MPVCDLSDLAVLFNQQTSGVELLQPLHHVSRAMAADPSARLVERYRSQLLRV